MADKLENALNSASDAAYVRAIDSNGNSIQISKADLAKVINSLINSTKIEVDAGGIYTFDFTSGIIAIYTLGLQSASAIVSFPAYTDGTIEATVNNLSNDVFIGGDVTAINKFALWRNGDKCYLRNNWDSRLSFVYTKIAVK